VRFSDDGCVGCSTGARMPQLPHTRIGREGQTETVVTMADAACTTRFCAPVLRACGAVLLPRVVPSAKGRASQAEPSQPSPTGGREGKGCGRDETRHVGAMRVRYGASVPLLLCPPLLSVCRPAHPFPSLAGVPSLEDTNAEKPPKGFWRERRSAERGSAEASSSQWA
jgi:hypothetical protein